MKEHKNTIISISVSIIISVICLFSIYTLYQDHQNLKEVISFLNSQIKTQNQIQTNK